MKKTGYVCNDIQQYKQFIKEDILEKTHIIKMSKKAIEDVKENYSIIKMCNEYRKVYGYLGEKMKVGILTHYDVNNQGAQLQMYALYKELEKIGHEPIILTYIKNYDFDVSKKLTYQPSIKSIPTYFKEYVLKRGIASTVHNYKKLSKNKMFRKRYFTFDNYATSDIDLAVVGSDEVFSVPMGVNMMMFGHCVNTKNVISYAPSFGQTDVELLEKYHAKNLVKSGLENFVDLSARDNNTKEVIENLTGIQAKMVCDPVLLYDFSQTKVEFKVPSKKYLVVYAYDYNMTDIEEVNAIKQFAKQHGLITVSPGTYHKWCDKNIACNALEWIEIFRNAEFVVTDTFHGTIVSSICNTPMAVMVRKSLNSNKLIDLLSKLQIQNRKLQKITIEELNRVMNDNYNSENVNNAICNLRKDSENYLKDAISKCEKGK